MNTGYEIKGKTALVTGANRGIGREIVETFLQAGAARVYLAVRRLETATPLLETYGDRVQPVYLDMNETDSIKQAALTASDVQVVVNNAGVLSNATPLGPNAIESLQYEMNTNVFGLIRVAQAFAPVLKANGGGALVQINSVASMKSFVNFSTYSASKAAAYSITQALRELLAAQNTIVVSVHPGPIVTDMGAEAGVTEIAEPPAVVAEGIVEALRVGRFHLFPDSIAKKFGDAYQRFSEEIVEANLFAE